MKEKTRTGGWVIFALEVDARLSFKQKKCFSPSLVISFNNQ